MKPHVNLVVVQYLFLNDPSDFQFAAPHQQRYPSINLTKKGLSSAELLPPPTTATCRPLWKGPSRVALKRMPPPM